MATVKVRFHASSIATREGALYYRITHERQVRQISAGFKLYASEWNETTRKPTPLPGMEEGRRQYLLSQREALAKDLDRLEDIISLLDSDGAAYTVDRIIELYRSRSGRDTFIFFARRLIAELEQLGRIRTSETYAAAVRSFTRFRAKSRVLLDEMDTSMMAEYEFYLKQEGLCPNSTSFYMRNLRAIYNRAVDQGLTPQNFPFRRVYTGVEKTVKRAIPLKTIRRLRDMELSATPAADFARDLFMFSFYTRGMAFVDMAYLRKSDLRGGVLSYRRQKTGKQLYIKWEKPMQQIIAKYDTSGTPYLLPIIRNAAADSRPQYLNAAHSVNIQLRKLGEQLDLAIPLTSYVARHSWASIARSKNIPVAIISEAMGHDSEKTTRIYLASLDTSVVDKANHAIIKSL